MNKLVRSEESSMHVCNPSGNVGKLHSIRCIANICDTLAKWPGTSISFVDGGQLADNNLNMSENDWVRPQTIDPCKILRIERNGPTGGRQRRAVRLVPASTQSPPRHGLQRGGRSMDGVVGLALILTAAS
ncbi:uncharacterized protein SPSK_10030 [Sporothrix schenckii 1099-18]|uniref:Uncharacterized protein n=1 Tax=Sporothrix schenckii 1099-18 TaxID=1397361 RepID=A0A0F2M3L1_SPOSC|nr:uncharacterized protein SPSK_10030 [Sporothrix schenckii 1099-18]KJR84283.1 hypothetical protein SPSK_10030 [Sporothrix schenckii 1099-18]